MLTKATAYAPPSAIVRAALSLALLVGFYVVLLGAASLLFAFPVAVVLFTRGFSLRELMLFGVCWVPAGSLLWSVFTTRRPRFVPPPRRLTQQEAPALFEMIEELASRSGIAKPDEVYLDPLANLGVTEVGGIFRGRRVLLVGGPLLCLLSVDELRAGIAHELGQFMGGDTRLTTFSVQTHALFTSVLSAVRRHPFHVGTQHYAIEAGFALAQGIGRLLVNGYGRLYLRLTRPLGRRQELAADALAGALVGSPIAARMLEKISLGAPLYEACLQGEVSFAMKRGAMPTDLVAGFERLLASDAGRRLVDSIRTRATDPYDTHPALADRLAALEPQSVHQGASDERPASSLFADPVAFETWLWEATRDLLLEALAASSERVGTLRGLPWASIPREIYAPAALAAACRAADRLSPLLPTATTLGRMFAEVWRRLEAGGALELAQRLEPGLDRWPAREVWGRAMRVCQELLAVLLQGALLEQGAIAEDSLGEATLVLRLEDERINTLELLHLLATDATAGRVVLNRWAERLAGASAAPLS